MLLDHWGRQITYLRISVTDRCNLRCVYCMPPEGVRLLPHEAMMRYEEIARVVAEAAQMGIRRVRLTGGDPLVRPDLPKLVRMIADVPGIEDISLTTNGILLDPLAPELRAAGLKRVNISLDSLQPEKFARITRGGSLETTWRGIEAAEKAGLRPVKINVVAMRGVNDDELPALARLSVECGWDVRFIELMPVNNQAPWGTGFPAPSAAYLPTPEIKAILAPLGLETVPENGSDGPAREFRLKGSSPQAGRIGFISPVSEHFCQSCNRMRMTADGHFRPCLLYDDEIFFLPALRRGETAAPFLQQAVDSKPGGHDLAEGLPDYARSMRQIGG